MNSKRSIAIIPARAGSKRLPQKNKLQLDGIPLIVYSIQCAKTENFIEQVFITTDDPDIKQIGLEQGVEVIERPARLCDDNATTVSALRHVIQTLDYEVENVILLQPTNPLRPDNLLREAYTIYINGKYDSLMTVSRIHKKLGKIENDHFVPYNYSLGQRSQDLDPLYYENGLLYITKASLIMQEKILGKNNYPFIVKHPFGGVDIDYQEDLEYAEYLIQKRKKNK